MEIISESPKATNKVFLQIKDSLLPVSNKLKETLIILLGEAKHQFRQAQFRSKEKLINS
jgi:hypothetical protein